AGLGRPAQVRGPAPHELSYWTMMGARAKANLRPTSSTTLIWQVYSPRVMPLRGIWTCTGTASGRVGVGVVASMGPTSKGLTGVLLKRLMVTLTRRSLASAGSGSAS